MIWFRGLCLPPLSAPRDRSPSTKQPAATAAISPIRFTVSFISPPVGCSFSHSIKSLRTGCAGVHDRLDRIVPKQDVPQSCWQRLPVQVIQGILVLNEV